jgi:hypothetical protein
MKHLYNAVVTTLLSISTINVSTLLVDSAAAQNNIVFCSDIVPSDESSSFEVCSTGYYLTPSPFAFENGTTGYSGGYTNGYTIVKGVKEGQESTGNPDESTGIEITVSRDDFDVCTVSVVLTEGGNDAKCTSCSYCGNDSYKANCTNIENGRLIDVCESAGADIVFFPLSANTLSNSVALPVESNSSFMSWIMTYLQNFFKRVFRLN